jgi:hypothetical protein
VNIQPLLSNMKTYYDIEIVSKNGDIILVSSISYSTMMRIAHNNPTLQTINIVKEYEKKEKR